MVISAIKTAKVKASNLIMTFVNEVLPFSLLILTLPQSTGLRRGPAEKAKTKANVNARIGQAQLKA